MCCLLIFFCTMCTEYIVQSTKIGKITPMLLPQKKTGFLMSIFEACLGGFLYFPLKATSSCCCAAAGNLSSLAVVLQIQLIKDSNMQLASKLCGCKCCKRIQGWFKETLQFALLAGHPTSRICRFKEERRDEMPEGINTLQKNVARVYLLNTSEGALAQHIGQIQASVDHICYPD